MLHTGDISNLSKPEEFDTVEQILKGAKPKDVFYVPRRTRCGLKAQSVDEHEAILEVPGGTRNFSIKILGQQSSGIYVCFAEPVQDGGEAKTQSVFLLKGRTRAGC